jgi:hypothetical protein
MVLQRYRVKVSFRGVNEEKQLFKFHRVRSCVCPENTRRGAWLLLSGELKSCVCFCKIYNVVLSLNRL